MKPQDIRTGTLFYECGSGMNLEAVATTDPKRISDLDDKPRWSWEGRNLQTGEAIDYLQTEGLECYGPRLYEAPQYVCVQEGALLYPMYGGDLADMDDEARAARRTPESLMAWVADIERTGTPVSIDKWYESLDHAEKPAPGEGHEDDFAVPHP